MAFGHSLLSLSRQLSRSTISRQHLLWRRSHSAEDVSVQAITRFSEIDLCAACDELHVHQEDRIRNKARVSRFMYESKQGIIIAIMACVS